MFQWIPVWTIFLYFQQLEKDVLRKDREYSDLTSKKNAILVNHGKLQQEAEVKNYSFVCYVYFYLFGIEEYVIHQKSILSLRRSIKKFVSKF